MIRSRNILRASAALVLCALSILLILFKLALALHQPGFHQHEIVPGVEFNRGVDRRAFLLTNPHAPMPLSRAAIVNHLP